jgi:hypothetical protein
VKQGVTVQFSMEIAGNYAIKYNLMKGWENA